MPASVTETWIDFMPAYNRRFRPALERFRRTQLRAGSRYSASRSCVPVLAMAVVWVRFAEWKPGSDVAVFLSQTETVRHILAALSVIAAWNLWLGLSHFESRQSQERVRAESIRLVLASLLCGAVAFCWGIAGRSLEHGMQLVSLVTAGLLIVSVANLGGFALLSALSPRLIRKRVAIVVGTGPRSAVVRRRLLARFSDVRIFGCVDDEFLGSDSDRTSYLGTIDRLPDLLKSQPIELVLIGLPLRSKYDEIQRVVEICEVVGVESHYMQDIFATERARVQPHAQAPEFLSLLTVFWPKSTQAAKRVIDVAGAVLLLLLFSPLMLAAAIAVRCTSPGPVLFRQQRYGRHRRLFPMLKFRSMVQDAELRQPGLERENEAQGPVFKLKQDPRVTRVGGFLRRTSIDELPQLFNVLSGQMSLVGPRPLPVRDVSRFEASWQLRRFSVRPGLTCLWQINGRSNTGFDNWIKQDLEYIDNWSLALDLKILARTVPVVLRGDGAV